MSFKTFLPAVILVTLFVVFALAGCTLTASEPTPVPSPTLDDNQTVPGGGEIISGLAQVDSIEMLILESFPVQVNVVVRGNLPDGCTSIDQVLSELDGNTFRVTLTTRRPADAACTMALVPYEQVATLDVLGLRAGTYSVDANGVSGSFELAIDNILPETPTPKLGEGTISGIVWHDLCAVAGGEGGQAAVPSPGCVSDEAGGFRANGMLEPDEPGIPNVSVDLGQGNCPSTGLAVAKSDQDGRFTFTNLPAGNYCISIDPEGFENGQILIPGRFTFPGTDIGAHLLALGEGESVLNLNFAWDFQFLPEPEPTPVVDLDCENQAAFVEDITIPDNTQIAGGERFDKTWRLKNTGTCTWSRGYTVVFSGGDQMGAPASIQLTQTIEPDEEFDLTIQFTAPAAAGTYRSEWLLRGNQEVEFGIGRNADQPFWVQIQSIETLAGLDLGEPSYVDNFSSSARFFLVNSANTKFEIDDGELVMQSFSPGSFDEWGLANYPSQENFYLEATVRTGETCDGLDRYGLLVRAPDPGQGYVFGFSCDGRYRLYTWDGSNYNALAEWTTNSNIKSGPEQTNKIGILFEDETIKLFANGILLVELTDRTFDSGQFGLFVAAGRTPNFTAYVNELSLWEMDN